MIVFEMTAKTQAELITKLAEYQQKNETADYGTTIKIPVKDGEIWLAQIVKSSCT